jgi:hypothetical protein
MKLILEQTEKYDVIKESVKNSDGSTSMYITGPFLQAEKVNRNGRVYPERVLMNAVSKYQKDYISKNRALGELNHPEDPAVNPERAAILTTELTRDTESDKPGSAVYVMGKAKVLSTPVGKIVECLINDGVTLGVSSRGLGSVEKGRDGIAVIQENFTLTAAADIVHDPSAQNSFVKAMSEGFIQGVYEGVEYYMNEDGSIGKINMELEREKLLRARKEDLMEKQLKLFNKFLSSL